MNRKIVCMTLILSVLLVFSQTMAAPAPAAPAPAAPAATATAAVTPACPILPVDANKAGNLGSADATLGTCDCSKCRANQYCCPTANGYCGCFPMPCP